MQDSGGSSLGFLSALLAAKEISKSYGAVHALRAVSFEMRRGEVHALIGENGAGKSTLIKVLTGAVQPDSGTIEIDGARIDHNEPNAAKALGIAVIYQQPALFPDLTVAENVALSLERQTLWRRVNWRDRRKRAEQLLLRIGSHISPEAVVSTLSMPEQQMVEIAKALGADAKILILDEPSASLTEREVQNLFRVIRELRARGVGLIYISHRLEELSQIADRVSVLRDGQMIGTHDMAAVSRSELIQLMVGRELSAVFPKRQAVAGETLLQVENIRGSSFSIRAGEILGIAGLVGSGRTELAETIFGLRPMDDGRVLLRNQPVTLGSPAQAVANGIAYVPEDRRRNGLVMEMSIAANTTLAALRTIARIGFLDFAFLDFAFLDFAFLDFARERALASEYLDRLAIKAPSVSVPVDTLSGGNQQKVLLARWLATRPSVLILDEPTQGVDVGAKSEIHRLIGELAGGGLAILMISSELPEILGMSDRIAVMHGGRITTILNRAEATQERILELALGSAA
ncbi:MAG: sugar ABC transporter ATP-binding protein [Acidobacteriota bacterium]|nr:sugar ABC transporter ATP-binding protein [Acidobacteriota bacterium]